jgi:hypothetical protein
LCRHGLCSDAIFDWFRIAGCCRAYIVSTGNRHIQNRDSFCQSFFGWNWLRNKRLRRDGFRKSAHRAYRRLIAGGGWGDIAAVRQNRLRRSVKHRDIRIRTPRLRDRATTACLGTQGLYKNLVICCCLGRGKPA